MNATRNESWKPVVGFEGRYEVSDQGRVRTVPRRARRGKGTIPVKAKTKSLYLDKSGYWRVSLSDENQVRTQLVHRLVALAFLGPEEDGHEVRHIDGDPGNAELTNLRWGSHSDNELDKSAHGTQYNRNKDECPKGHIYAGSNLYVNPNGSRECRSCRQDRVRIFKASRREQAAA